MLINPELHCKTFDYQYLLLGTTTWRHCYMYLSFMALYRLSSWPWKGSKPLAIKKRPHVEWLPWQGNHECYTPYIEIKLIFCFIFELRKVAYYLYVSSCFVMTEQTKIVTHTCSLQPRVEWDHNHLPPSLILVLQKITRVCIVIPSPTPPNSSSVPPLPSPPLLSSPFFFFTIEME